ncbi:C6 transcription factor [Aspergillus costaricaensis CBS 115574]|uniref:C6 transcription factor n=1 Tax=Aspergillus costaricaensis CBS 115574 TaxID=1448317 RepID=A0ACD1I9T6_9EURO|nr:C6 transcription factor [Aspergillus costaricaensis CBS 115574]RAK87142.1 C6 transcription factor [Aspergillus costaricaensis CBS 115574]
MPPRRAHTKSRNGCDQCKSRRVKCDEAQPCANCVKRHLTCTFERRPPKPEPYPSTQSGKLSESPTVSSRTDDAIAAFQHQVADASAFLREWGAQDPELMHHYCIYASKTLSDREVIRDVWQVEVPKIAYSYEFLMHGILSLSALHLAYTRPERYSHYLNSSNFHMALGLQTFRIILQNPTKQNCEALFCFSSLIMVWTCGAPTDLGDSRPLESIIRLFNLCRGIMTLQPFMSHVENGPLAPLFLRDFRSDPGLPEDHVQSLHFPGLGDQLDAIRQLIASEPLSEQERLIYQQATDCLGKAFWRLQVCEKPAQCGIIYMWPISVRDEFVGFLLDKSPIGLILLAQYCAQLYLFRGYWFVEDRAQELLSAVTAALPSRLAHWLDWPRQFCSSGTLPE